MLLLINLPRIDHGTRTSYLLALFGVSCVDYGFGWFIVVDWNVGVDLPGLYLSNNKFG